jgi:hypothetical protein
MDDAPRNRFDPSSPPGQVGAERSPPGQATPILVVGRNRSGTKWLSNVLLNHPAIAGVQAEGHAGIVETTLFGTMERLVDGDLRSTENYIAFLLLWSATDFFRFSGVDAEYFFALDPRPETPLQAFRVLMEEVARRSGAGFWLQKASLQGAERVLEHYGDARVILIRRDLITNLESTLAMPGNRGRHASLAKLAFGFALDEKASEQLKHRHSAYSVTYEDLRRDTAGVTEGICKWLGLEFDPGMVDVRFRRNTSFKEGGRRTLTPSEARIARLTYRVARALPPPVLRRLRRAFEPAEPPIPRWMFREIRHRYGLP